MKKIMPIVIVLLASLLLASCRRDDEPIGTIEDFFPRIPDRLTFFEGAHTERRLGEDGNEAVRERELELIFFEDYVHEYLSQRRGFQWVDGVENVAVEVFRVRDGNLYNIRGMRGVFARTDFTGEGAGLEVLILSEPLAVGREWVRADLGHTVDTAKIISMDTEITVPYGTFSTMVVEVTSAAGQTLEYYAKGYGLVKLQAETPQAFQYHHLTAVEYAPFTEYIEIFAGWEFETETAEDGFVYVHPIPDARLILVEYHTNADIPALYMGVFRKFMSEEWGIYLDPALDINFINHDRDNLLLYVDFTAEIVPFLEGFGGRDMEVLQLIADTIGFRYDAAAVTFSADGEELASLVMTMYQNLSGFDEW